jgi:ATP-dependent exoDNAse (exonuclease V) beta subunit
MNIKIISAGAGSGKTYRLTSEMVGFLKPESDYQVRPSGIIATTFTNKAAAELQERVRVRLLSQGLNREADDLANALIGTVHGLGVKLLKRFSFEAGVSPEVDIIADEDQQTFFNQALAVVLSPALIQKMDTLSNRLGLTKKENYDWRKEVKRLTDIARNNAFDVSILQDSKEKSIESLLAFFPNKSPKTGQEFNNDLKSLLETTLMDLRMNEDQTKTTQNGINTLQGFFNNLKSKGYLNWHEWVKISKLKVGKKSSNDVETIMLFAQKVETHPDLHEDMSDFVSNVFDLSVQAIREYDNFKKRRGLIDYIDMEIHVNELLNHPVVQEVMTEELDLLMVDEFQDTSPIQLEIFLKLSKFAKVSVWVGDPKQSIYGFRGADPALMRAIIDKMGGVKPEDIQKFSWRSREDIVHAVNALFVKAFPNIPSSQVALEPKRTKDKDPIEQDSAIIHWHFEYEGKGKRLPGKPWMERCIASNIREMLADNKVIIPKDENEKRTLQAGDVAILCRSNMECQTVAEALHHMGLKAAIARNGLLQTAEAKLILACLKYILNDRDSLSVAEILLLADGKNIEGIIDHRLKFMQTEEHSARWAMELDYIKELRDLRSQVVELSSAEILSLVMEELDIRRIVAAWGNPSQRLSNLDALSKLSLQYEENCNRLHTAASLGGFLLWLAELEGLGLDAQGSGEGKDAVNVMTYHKSKGLEWPVVVCHSLEGNLRDNVWGINIEGETKDVDLDNVLGGRWLRYWVNPFTDQIKKTPLEERINTSDAKAKAQLSARQEEARLLYVGMTRARDYLVIPSRKMPTKWLNRCFHKDQDTPTLDPHTHETPWHWTDEKKKFFEILKETRIKTLPKIFEKIQAEISSIEYAEPRDGQKEHRDLLIDVENDDFSKEFSIQTFSPLTYQFPINAPEGVDEYIIAKIIKQFLIANEFHFNNEEKTKLAEELIERHGFSLDDVETRDIVGRSDLFYSNIEATYEIKNIYKKIPIQYKNNRQYFSNVVDIVADTEKGWIVIQNTSHRTLKGWPKKAKSLQNWFYFAEKAIRLHFNIPADEPCRLFLHFVLGGGMIEVKVKERKRRQMSLGL